MPIVKRYTNRKLYDTLAKRYVTLADLAAMIRRGDDVTVVDHASGDDITTQVQAQIIFEQERQAASGLPNNVFSGLIQASNQTLKQLRQTLWPENPDTRVDAEIERRVRMLIERGELKEKQGVLLLAKLLAVQPTPLRTPQERALERALVKRGTPSSDQLEDLAARIDDLAQELDELDPRPSKRKRLAKA
jgi:polyhydroxyalkanoate synthesis repressor PhaR